MKQQLFLASEVNLVASHFVKKIKKPVAELKAVFIPTAGEVEKDQEWIKPNRNGLNKAGIKTFDYTIKGKSLKEIEKDLGDCDLIHVNGGNTFYLLLQAKKSGFDKFIKRQLEKGVIYTGSSAGSIIASSDIGITSYYETKVYEKELPDTKGFNLVDFVIFPHWGSPLFKDLYQNHRIMTAYKKGSKIILLNDDQYVEVTDGSYKIVDVKKE